MKRLTIGILAHVDAGKTTCVESMLYTAGVIRKAGRVDHRDTVLDFDPQERDHGITIWAKEAHFPWKDTEVQVIDTPGHVDFSAEMERCLHVLDLAVMIINGQDGVQSHTLTIWQCLQHYRIPTIIFVNKMDISHVTKEDLLLDLQKQCHKECIDWQDEERNEKLAMVNDDMLTEYTETEEIRPLLISDAFYRREFYPVLFGSVLKFDQVDTLMDTISFFARNISYPEAFGARVYKVSMDDTGTRLTHMKITGGSLNARDKISEKDKADQIRVYNGTKYEMIQRAEAGMVVCVKGFETVEAGQGLGFEQDEEAPLLQAYMHYQLVLPTGTNVLVLADTLKEIASQDPLLEINVDEHTKQIDVQIMGRMQMEVLQKKIAERTGVVVGFSTGKILYQETIGDVVYGAGHFEPLRHYAEVHVRLEPLPQGSGIVVESEIANDDLSSAWQKSILSVLERTRHRGVLTGSLLTDVRIVLVAGKGNIKHTSGGDFRQAANRAVRQALMKADNILLEPYYTFTMEVPSASLSHALFDLDQRNASVEVEELENNRMRIKGEGPVRTLVNYQDELITYTGGSGRFSCTLKGYEPSIASEQIQQQIDYHPEMDLYRPADSVFCANGTGYTVPWDKADEMMHIQLRTEPVSSGSYTQKRYRVSDRDLEYIMSMTTSKNRNPEKQKAEEHVQQQERKKVRQLRNLPHMMIVDGYNMIYAWDSLKEVAHEDLSAARDLLIRDLYNYLPYYDHPITVVFDAYKVKDNSGSTTKKGDLTIVYTKSQETADAWLERSAYELKNQYQLTYATSDQLIQNAVFSQGAMRMSAKELETVLKMHHVILGQ